MGTANRCRLGDRRGFTLIEMLVVMSILGILAAVVTLGVTGMTSLAQKRALDDERMQVQSALNAMMLDQRIDPGDACASFSGATADMTAFPTRTRYAGSSSRHAVALAPHYLRGNPTTHRAYVCRPNGSVDPGP